MARYARRPMRPKPLMPTLIAIAYLLSIQILNVMGHIETMVV